MSKVFIEESTLTAIGDAIRAKNGSSELIAPQDMDTAITNLPTGDIVLPIPDEAFNNSIGGNAYKFYKNTWLWFIEEYGEQIEPHYIDEYMFSWSDITSIPFQIYFDPFYNSSYAFYNCQDLTEITNVQLDNSDNSSSGERGRSYCHLFDGCYRLRTLPSELFGDGIKYLTYSKDGDRSFIFHKCYSLRELPNLENLMNNEINNSLYYGLAYWAVCLNKIEDLPISPVNAYFTYTFDNCYRLNNMTFATNNGTPKTANWSNRTIDLSNYVGWVNPTYSYYVTGYNSGVYGRVHNALTYNDYKNTEHWYSEDVAYSRYNKISAMNTINSLPTGCSNCIIKFKGEAGSSTDGGAINTMTEEQIAVATAKGFTVAYV